jgi:hypothetical protein
MAPFAKPPVLRKEGQHYKFDDLEFWAEDGVICIVDARNGDINAVTCKEFVERAEVINREAKRATYASDQRRLNDCVLNMYEVWKEAKQQGDPTDPAVMRQRLKDRKRAILTPSLIW